MLPFKGTGSPRYTKNIKLKNTQVFPSKSLPSPTLFLKSLFAALHTEVWRLRMPCLRGSHPSHPRRRARRLVGRRTLVGRSARLRTNQRVQRTRGRKKPRILRKPQTMITRHCQVQMMMMTMMVTTGTHVGWMSVAFWRWMVIPNLLRRHLRNQLPVVKEVQRRDHPQTKMRPFLWPKKVHMQNNHQLYKPFETFSVFLPTRSLKVGPFHCSCCSHQALPFSHMIENKDQMEPIPEHPEEEWLGELLGGIYLGPKSSMNHTQKWDLYPSVRMIYIMILDASYPAMYLGVPLHGQWPWLD